MQYLPPRLQEAVQKLEQGLKDLYRERFRGLLLYGSYARGDFREGSDVDLLLLLDGPVNSVGEILHLEDVKWPLSLEYDTVISVMPVSLQDFEKAETMFLSVVRQEAVPAA
jgi:predicted nucleotidyltransferase